MDGKYWFPTYTKAEGTLHFSAQQGALSQDVHIAEQAVLKLVKVAITQGQFDALVDFVYNLGTNRLAASTLLRDLNIGRYDAAAEQLLMWDHVGTKEVAGLKARREAEFHLWHNPLLRAEVISWT